MSPADQDMLVLARHAAAGRWDAFAKQLRLSAARARREGDLWLADQLNDIASNTRPMPRSSSGRPSTAGAPAHRPVYPPQVERELERIIGEHERMGTLREHGLTASNRILLTGLPGTGKTTFARILADRLHMEPHTVRLEETISSHLGATLKNIADMFDRIETTGGLLFVDEADSLLARRDNQHDVAEMRRATNLMLQRIDTFPPDAVLVCATNMTGLIDPAAYRRFDTIIDMPLPDRATALRIIRGRAVEIRMGINLADDADYAGISPARLVRAVDAACRTSLLDGRDHADAALFDRLARMGDEPHPDTHDRIEPA